MKVFEVTDVKYNKYLVLVDNYAQAEVYYRDTGHDVDILRIEQLQGKVIQKSDRKR